MPFDDEQAVSHLEPGFSARWEESTVAGRTATARVADHLGVPIVVAHTPELPTGHDLVLLAGVGRGLTTAAAQFACTELSIEPQLATGYGSGLNDVEWMQKTADVRQRAATADPAHVPDAIAAMAAILAQAHAAGVPVLLDGAIGAAAAYACSELPDAHIPSAGDEPVQRCFTDHLDVPVWGITGLPNGEGLGALAGLAWLRLGLLSSDV